MGMIGEIRVSAASTFAGEVAKSSNVKLAADSICQPCVWSDTYKERRSRLRRGIPSDTLVLESDYSRTTSFLNSRAFIGTKRSSRHNSILMGDSACTE